MEGTNLKIIIIINKEGKENSGTDLSNHYDDFFLRNHYIFNNLADKNRFVYFNYSTFKYIKFTSEIRNCLSKNKRNMNLSV